MTRERIQIGIGFFIISVIWGSTWLAIKIGLGSIPPLFALALRFSLATMILYVVMKIKGEKAVFDVASMPLYVSLALLSFSIPFALVYWAEQYIASGLASVLFAVYPFVVAIGSHLFLANERLTSYKLAGVVAGFAGVTIIFWSDIHIGSEGTLAMGAVLLSTVLQGASLVMVKRIGKHANPMAMSLGGMTFALLVLYALAFSFESASDVHLDAAGIGTVLYLGSFGTVVTFVIYYWLLKRVEAVFLSLVSLVTPILAVVLGALWLGEALSPRVYVGAACVLAGILVANSKDLIRMRSRRGISALGDSNFKSERSGEDR